MKTSELQGAALDWAVAKAQGYFDDGATSAKHFLDMREAGVHWTRGSTDWAEGGPIIERECVDIMFEGPEWYAYMRWEDKTLQYDGPTPLIAAMRCYVASKLGDEIDVPNTLKG